MLEIRDMEFSYEKEDSKTLKDIDLNVAKGEIISILGPSGAGKSTLLRCINCMNVPKKGEIVLNEKTILYDKINKKDIHYLRKNISMVFQHYSLFQNKTVIQNIAEGLKIVHKKSKHEAEEIAAEMLKQVGLEDKIYDYPNKLSGGQKQRVGIARALAIQPKLILFDEPTSALDSELVGEVLETIKQVAEKGIAMVIVTHEISFAREISDEIIFMDKGRVVEKGTPSEIIEGSAIERVNNFFKRTNNEKNKKLEEYVV